MEHIQNVSPQTYPNITYQNKAYQLKTYQLQNISDKKHIKRQNIPATKQINYKTYKKTHQLQNISATARTYQNLAVFYMFYVGNMLFCILICFLSDMYIKFYNIFRLRFALELQLEYIEIENAIMFT